MEKLVKKLHQNGVLENPLILRAFMAIDRANFVPEKFIDEAYGDYPIPIGHNQTISQPYTVAFMLDLLEIKGGEKILDVGSGSGWTTALLSSAVGHSGKVFGTEIIPELVALGQKNIAKYELPNAEIRQAQKNILGLPKEAPFYKILVSAAGRSYPKKLIAQLKDGGIMVIPIESRICRIRKISADKSETEEFEGFVFVPLIE